MTESSESMLGWNGLLPIFPGLYIRNLAYKVTTEFILQVRMLLRVKGGTIWMGCQGNRQKL